jgi:chemotaxis protein methyltransferase CheR
VPIDPLVSPTDFTFVRRLVHEHSGLELADGKEYLVRARLGPIVQREGLGSVTELVVRLRNAGHALRDDVVEAMATNETSFLRDVQAFDTLRDKIIPDLLRVNGGSGLRMWSAAASTGQEAYSLAMLVRAHFINAAPISILASDFSNDVLDYARAGVYSQLEVNRGLPAAMLVRFFAKHGVRWQVSKTLRDMVQFRSLNLVRPLPVLPAMDVVFLRNVLIYFDSETKIAVMKRVANAMRRGGYLFLGSAESTRGIDNRFERVPAGKSGCYRLKGPYS